MLPFFLFVVALTSVCGQPGWHQYTNPAAFATWLRQIEHSQEFAAMSLEEKLLFGELVMAAEQGSSELTALIQRVTFIKVMALTDEFNEEDMNHFEKYLTAHLPKRATVRSIEKRDFFSALNELHVMHDITHHLPPHERSLFFEMMTAAKSDSLTTFIDQRGYGAVLSILTYLKGHHAHDLDHLIITQLHKESMAHKPTTPSQETTTSTTTTPTA